MNTHNIVSDEFNLFFEGVANQLLGFISSSSSILKISMPIKHKYPEISKTHVLDEFAGTIFQKNPIFLDTKKLFIKTILSKRWHDDMMTLSLLVYSSSSW